MTVNKIFSNAFLFVPVLGAGAAGVATATGAATAIGATGVLATAVAPL